MEASVEVVSVEASVEAFMEASAEVNSLEASTKNFRGSFNGSFHELPPKMQIVQVTLINRHKIFDQLTFRYSHPKHEKKRYETVDQSKQRS